MFEQKYLNELFDYKEGELYWKVRKSQRSKIGSKCGYVASDGYMTTTINGKSYKNHRIIYMMFNGFLPEYIDHINGNLLDNRIENLRPATVTQNQYNQSKRKDNTSGVKGVTWSKLHKKWIARLNANKKTIHVGLFDDINEADKSLQEARKLYHGEFARNK